MIRSVYVVLFLIYSSLLFGPFMGHRVLRTAGDDKVYVSQAVEMARDGNWFVQTIADQPDYYKGPAHFLLLRLGIAVFGSSMWATVYMHFILLVCAGLVVFHLFSRFPPAGLVRRPEESPEAWAFWAAGTLVSGIGVYLHAYASQMEVELVAFFTFALAAAIYARESSKAETWFWVIAGVTGWFKSPVHSVFIGAGGVFYWLFTGVLHKKLLSLSSWLKILLGIVISAGGYLPAAILDTQNFYNTFILREQANKGPSGEPWWSPVWPILTFYLTPWMLVAFAGYIDLLFRLIFSLRKSRGPSFGIEARRVLLSAACFLLPMMLFFAYWDYRMQNYTLPSAASMSLLMGYLWSSASSRMRWLYQGALGFTGLIFILAAGGILAFGARFEKLPPGFSDHFFIGLSLGVLITGLLWLSHALRSTEFPTRPHRVLLASVPFYLALGWFYVVVGEREMMDLNHLIQRGKACSMGEHAPPLKLAYYNTPRKLWSEWGYLNFMVGYPVHGLHTPEQALKAALEGEVILISTLHKEFVEEFKGKVLASNKRLEMVQAPWKRWRTHGKDESGNPLWKAAWIQRDLSLLETDFWMIQFKEKGARNAFNCGSG